MSSYTQDPNYSQWTVRGKYCRAMLTSTTGCHIGCVIEWTWPLVHFLKGVSCVFFLGFVKAVTSLLTLVANLFSESLSESKACVPADFFLSLSHPGSTCIFFFFPQVNFHKLKKLTLTEELLLPVSYGESSTIVRAEHSEVKPMELIRGYSMCSTGVTTHNLPPKEIQYSFKAHWLNKNPMYNMGI